MNLEKPKWGQLYISVYSGEIFKVYYYSTVNDRGHTWVYYTREPDQEPYGSFSSALDIFNKELRPLTETEKVLYG